MKKSRHLLLLKLFAVIGLSLLLSSSARAWRVQLPGGSRAETVVVDHDGNIIAAGRAYYGGELIKLSGTTGELIWQFNASHNLTEQGVAAIALDSHGDILALFANQRSVTKISGVTGQVIWHGLIGGTTAGCQSFFFAVVVDHEDNVVVAGTSGCLFSVAKLDGVTGNERWHYEHEGYAKAVAVDPFGNVAAAGIINFNFGTVKLRGDNGAELWERELNGAGNFTDVFGFEEANAVALDHDGSVVAVGATQNEAGSRDFTVVRYLPGGAVDWIKIVNGFFRVSLDALDQSNDTANAVVIDQDGSVIAAGFVQESLEIPPRPEPAHFHVIKISRNGNIVWSRPAEDPLPMPPGEAQYRRGFAFSLSVNAFGNVVAGGLHNARFTLVKFWGRTGGRAWRRQLASGTDPSDNGNQANRVVMDAASDVIAAGETIPPEGGLSQFTVAKLNRKDGLDFDGDAPPDNVPDVVIENAPYVYLYSDDQYRPGNPLTFISNSSLGWSHAGGCTDAPVAALGAVQPQRLGVNNGVNRRFPYSHNPILPPTDSPDCTHDFSVTFKSSDYTRPYDKERGDYTDNPYWYIWYNSFYEKEGFYLALDNRNPALRDGIPDEPGNPIYPGAPVFYEYVEHKYITYWFFYPYDSFDVRGIAVQEHEGDWERVSIQLDGNDEPVNVFYYQHKDGMLTPWGTIDKYDGSHPIVFSAKGSHASYPDEGEYETHCLSEPEGCFLDRANRGKAWLTWNDLAKVEAQPWYGFGGAWGKVRDRGIFVPGSDSTGPLGPSRFKRSEITWDRFPYP